ARTASASAASAWAFCDGLKKGKRITTPTVALFLSNTLFGKNCVQLLNFASTAYWLAKSTDGQSDRCSPRARNCCAIACCCANKTAGFDADSFVVSVPSCFISGNAGTDSGASRNELTGTPVSCDKFARNTSTAPSAWVI